METYSAEKARPLILNRSLKGEYAVIGSLDLSGCDLTRVTLPVEVVGSLDLSYCNLTGTTLPAKVTGGLDLSHCDLTDVTFPVEVDDWLDLSGCKNPDPSQWWRERGQTTKSHCLAINFYALIETEDGLYSAGCRGPWTAEQALEHWGEQGYERGKLFAKAIKANEERKFK